ncbi:MAG TPA: archaellin/type IV pilin N-terminal domain-containing protein [Thermoplasmata archaeon]|nr:archaellin/type IV pilin N-terminal domain-containing protein [Thermoplasmata archaeon]
MWTEKARSWRRKNKRGVSPIIATILLVAITVVLAAVLYILISGFTKGPGNTPLGTAFTYGSATQTSNGAAATFCAAAVGISDWCDNLPVGSAGGGITASSLNFAIRDANGNPVSFTHGTPSIQLESSSGTSLGTYSFTTGTWTVGGTTSLSTTQTLVLDTGCTVSGANLCSPIPTGEVLVALGVGSYSGQVQVTLV